MIPSLALPGFKGRGLRRATATNLAVRRHDVSGKLTGLVVPTGASRCLEFYGQLDFINDPFSSASTATGASLVARCLGHDGSISLMERKLIGRWAHSIFAVHESTQPRYVTSPNLEGRGMGRAGAPHRAAVAERTDRESEGGGPAPPRILRDVS